MVVFKNYKLQTDGTNDVPMQLSGPMISILIVPQTTTVDIAARPSAGSDFIALDDGRTLSLEPIGRTIDTCVLTVRNTSAAACTVDVLVGYP